MKRRALSLPPLLFAGASLAIAVAHAGDALAQAFPLDKAIRLVVPYLPGGSADALARMTDDE